MRVHSSAWIHTRRREGERMTRFHPSKARTSLHARERATYLSSRASGDCPASSPRAGAKSQSRSKEPPRHTIHSQAEAAHLPHVRPGANASDGKARRRREFPSCGQPAPVSRGQGAVAIRKPCREQPPTRSIDDVLCYSKRARRSNY